jgi:hypothetical protein
MRGNLAPQLWFALGIWMNARRRRFCADGSRSKARHKLCRKGIMRRDAHPEVCGAE